MKVCILTAGKGSRVTSFGGQLHKALLPVGNVAVISRIIGQFPDDADFVIAVGHLEQQIRDYLAVAHPDRAITFVRVDPYEGPGAGPGRSLWACREHLRTPFYITACDTLITTTPPGLEHNFMGVYPVEDPTLWCTLDTDADGAVRALHYKVPEGSRVGFVGFAGIVDTEVFWQGLGGHIDEQREYQVDAGFAALVASKRVVTATVGWIDVGTEPNYISALEKFDKNYTFYGKSTDVTYRHGDIIVKFFADHAISRARYERGRQNPAFAEVLTLCGGFFSCRYVHGTLLSRLVGEPGYIDVLEWLQSAFWRAVPDERATFEAACRSFYADKTLARLKAYAATSPADLEAGPLSVNGVACRPVRDAVAALSDAFWSTSIASTFHGDLHDDNILVSRPQGEYVLIDWRQDFAGLPDVGDRYYDLAKFFHTLDLSVEAMESSDLRIAWSGDASVEIAHHERPERVSAREAFWHFAARHDYDGQRIKLINGLIFVNMAPLYEKPLSDYLYLLGRLRIEEALALDGAAPALGGR